MPTALVLVDAQTGFFQSATEQAPVHAAAAVLERLRLLTTRARRLGVPVIYLLETAEPEGRWPIHPALVPFPNDVVVRTTGPEVFDGTALAATLDRLGADEVVVAGFRSESCVAGTVRAAAERGLGVTLAADAHSTFDTATARAVDVIAAQNASLASVATVRPVADLFQPAAV